MQAGTETDDKLEAACASCGATNRFPRARLHDDPRCGRCHTHLFPRRPVAVTDATFAREVEGSPLPVLVDFWAPWCGPCRAMTPVLDEIAARRAGRLKVVKVNVDENPATAARYGVRSIPTLIVMRGPLVVDQIAGALGRELLEARLDRVA